MTHPLAVVGVDVSLTSTGVASSLGWATRLGSKNVTKMPLNERIGEVERLSREILAHVGTPSMVVIEIPAFSRSGAGTLERSALWWLVVRGLARREIPVAGAYTGSRALYATGKGNASKAAIVDAVARRMPMFQTEGNDDIADAAILAAMGADHLGAPIAAMPQTHRRALAAVEWPKEATGQ